MSRSVNSLRTRSVAVKLIVAWSVVATFKLGLHSWLSPEMSATVAVSCFILLFAAILLASFGVVREADELAHRLGEPYGTLILTISIVAIEVILIAAVMLGSESSPTIGRDAIFAVMMIIMNLVTGICLLAGAVRFGEQEYNAPGAVTFISLILVFVGIAFLLPTSPDAGSGSFTHVQAIIVSAIIFVGYAAFLLLQMGKYKSDFMQPEPGRMWISLVNSSRDHSPEKVSHERDTALMTVHAVTLVALIVPIVLLAHDLAIIIDYGVAKAGAPTAVGGVLIAIIVFTPESVTAIKASLNDEAQRSINLCLGAFVSTVGLTVPAVLLVGLFTGKEVVFGISPTETVLLALTIGLTTLTYLGHRTSAAQGVLHLLMFFTFVLMMFTQP